MRLIAILVMFFAFGRAGMEQEFIFTAAPFESCHASTVVELGNGDIMAAWFGGSAEGNPDVAIWASHRTAGAWSTPAELVREPDIASYTGEYSYPAIVQGKSGDLHITYTWNRKRIR